MTVRYWLIPAEKCVARAALCFTHTSSAVNYMDFTGYTNSVQIEVSLYIHTQTWEVCILGVKVKFPYFCVLFGLIRLPYLMRGNSALYQTFFCIFYPSTYFRHCQFSNPHSLPLNYRWCYFCCSAEYTLQVVLASSNYKVAENRHRQLK